MAGDSVYEVMVLALSLRWAWNHASRYSSIPLWQAAVEIGLRRRLISGRYCGRHASIHHRHPHPHPAAPGRARTGGEGPCYGPPITVALGAGWVRSGRHRAKFYRKLTAVLTRFPPPTATIEWVRATP